MPEQVPGSESNRMHEKRIKEKVRELVERSKNPPHGLEEYPSYARSIEKALDEGTFEDVELYICDLAQYEEGGILAFCEWLTQYYPNMLYENHTLWIMMEEDGFDEEVIRDVYLKVGYDISDKKKETVLDIASLKSDGDSQDGIPSKVFILFLSLVIGLNVIVYFEYVDMRSTVYEPGDEISNEFEGGYAVYASSDTHDCEEDNILVQEKGNTIFNPELNRTVTIWRNRMTEVCDNFYNGHGWIYVGVVTFEDGSNYRVSASDNNTSVAFVGANFKSADIDTPGLLVKPLSSITLLMFMMLIYQLIRNPDFLNL